MLNTLVFQLLWFSKLSVSCRVHDLKFLQFISLSAALSQLLLSSVEHHLICEVPNLDFLKLDPSAWVS